MSFQKNVSGKWGSSYFVGIGSSYFGQYGILRVFLMPVGYSTCWTVSHCLDIKPIIFNLNSLTVQQDCIALAEVCFGETPEF